MARDRDGSAEGDPRLIRAVSRHIERFIGRPSSVFHERTSHLVHVDLHHVPPSERRPFHTLVTSGMSERPMHVPPDCGDPVFAELCLKLPESWPLFVEGALRQPRYGWPLELLSDLARYPHVERTWIGCSHVIQNGDPPRPYADSTRLCASLILHPASERLEFSRMKRRRRDVVFYQVVPIYEEELYLTQSRSLDVLMGLFAVHRVSEVIDPVRVNVGKSESSR